MFPYMHQGRNYKGKSYIFVLVGRTKGDIVPFVEIMTIIVGFERDRANKSFLFS